MTYYQLLQQRREALKLSIQDVADQTRLAPQYLQAIDNNNFHLSIFIENLNSVFNLHSLSFFPVVSVPVISMLVFVCALVVSATLNHIPIIKKYCV